MVNLNELRKVPEGHLYARWGLPEYTNWMEETMSWKENCYVGDWSFLWERWFKGPGVCRLFSEVTVNNLEVWNLYQSKHAIHCNSDGKIVSEEVISKLGEDEYMVFGRGAHFLNYYFNKNRERFPDVHTWEDDWFNLQVTGPNAIALLEKICGNSLRECKFMYSQKIWFGDMWMWVLRQGMSGEPGFELQGPIKWKGAVIERLMEAGAEYNIHRLGGRSVFINHLEACFPTIITDYLPAMTTGTFADYYDYFKASMPKEMTTFNVAGSFEAEDISDYYRSPVEFGWANRINFNHDFYGREALAVEKSNPKRIIRTLVWNQEDVIDVFASLFKQGPHYDFIDFPRYPRGVMYADKVMKNGKLVGITSSYGYSYFYRQMLCHCVIDIPESELGNEVTIIWGAPGHLQKEIRAVVSPSPYKPDNRKTDLHAFK